MQYPKEIIPSNSTFYLAWPHFYSTALHIQQIFAYKNWYNQIGFYEIESKKIRPNFRKQTISKIEVIKITSCPSNLIFLTDFFSNDWTEFCFNKIRFSWLDWASHCKLNQKCLWNDFYGNCSAFCNVCSKSEGTQFLPFDLEWTALFKPAREVLSPKSWNLSRKTDFRPMFLFQITTIEWLGMSNFFLHKGLFF